MAVTRIDPLQAELDTLEGRMRALRVLYDQYFLGIEKREPLKHKDDCIRMLREFDRRVLINTAVKFRLQMLKARWISLNQHWNRILKQIEDGTYRPHKIKAAMREKHRQKARGQMEAKQQAKGNGAAQPEQPQAAAAGAKKKGSPLDKLHQQYSTARAKTGEGNVDRDRLAKVVKSQAAAIKKKYKCRTVEFRVVIENGKTKLKAIPKN